MVSAPESDPDSRRGVLVHIGAGQADALPDYLAAGYSRVFLIEADPDLASELAGRVADQPRVDVISAAVTGKVKGKAEEVDFNFMNDPEFNSIRAPGKLSKLLPGIALIATRKVRALSVAELFEALPPLDSDDANALVIEAPGVELAILKGLAKSRRLSSFSLVRVRCDAETFYKKGSKAAEVLAWLKEQSYRIAGSNLEDPDWPVYDLELDHSAIELRALRTDFESARVQQADLEEQLARAQKEHENALAMAEAERASLQEQLASAKQQSDDARQAAEAERAALQEQLESARQESRDARQEVEVDRLAMQEQLERARQESREARQKAESQPKVDRDADLKMALRLQTIAQNDKIELQARYAKLQADHESQKELLLKLTQKLESAAEYLRRLPEPGSDEQSAVLLEKSASGQEGN